MKIKPVEFKRVGSKALGISWSDGSKHEINAEEIRRNCPCAECKEKRGEFEHDKPLAPVKDKKGLLRIVESSKDESVSLDQIWPIGNYALGILWGDGHQTGIYTYQLLFELGKRSEEAQSG